MTAKTQGGERKLLKLALVLVCGLAAFVLSAGWFAPQSGGDVVEARSPQDRPTVVTARMEVQAMPDVNPAPESRLDAESHNNPFGQLNLLPPAPASVGGPAKKAPPPKVVAPPVPPAPVAPTAPPLPFIAIGSIEGADATAGQKLAFLQQQETLLVVRKGEAIGSVYRVEDVSSERVEFTYLPLNLRQSLSFAH